MELLRTKIGKKFLFVEINEQHIENIGKFISHVLECHSIRPDEYDVKLFDQFKTPITKEIFRHIIKKFIADSNSFIEIECTSVKQKETSSQDIREKLNSFLKEAKFGISALAAYEKTNKLDLSSRQKVCGLTCDFIAEYFENNFDPVNIRLVCLELIEIFPILRVEPSEIGGIDLLYNTAKTCGFIYNCIKYRKSRSKSHSKEIEVNLEDQAVDAIQELTLDENLTESEKNEILLFFKTCHVKSDRISLIENLKKTINLRCDIIKEKHTELREFFPFYFVSPEIILEDFKIRWAGVNNEAIHYKWPLISARLSEWTESSFKKKYDTIDPNINLMIKLFSRLRQRRTTLPDALKNFIKVNTDPKTDPLNELNPNNNFPFIICIGNDSKNVQYFLHIGNQSIIPVPENFNFVDTFDMFFKTFKVLILSYSPKHAAILNFFGRYVYETSETTPVCSRVLEVKNDLLNTSEIANNNVEKV